MRNKVIIFLTTIAMLTLMTSSAFAVSAQLHSDEKIATSGTISCKQVKLTSDGYNSSTSKHSVYFTAQYKHNGKWCDNAQSLVAAGKHCASKKSFAFDTKHTWRLELNPKGPGTQGCTAKGYVLKVQ